MRCNCRQSRSRTRLASAKTCRKRGENVLATATVRYGGSLIRAKYCGSVATSRQLDFGKVLKFKCLPHRSLAKAGRTLDVLRQMIRRAIYPGSFDPVTNGHLDVIDRARKLFDEVIVAVAHNDQKHPLFSLEERLRFLSDSLGKIRNVEIAPLDGLLVNFAIERKATAVIRGLRAISDFEFEFQMALMNRKLEATVETIFLMPKEEYTYLSSRIVKEIARLGGDVTDFVPARVAKALRAKLKE